MSDSARKLFANKKSSAPSAAPVGGTLSLPKDVKRRWLYVGGGLVGLVILSSMVFGDKSDTRRVLKDPKKSALVSVNPSNADRAAFESRFASDLEQLKQQQQKFVETLDRKQREIDALKNRDSLPSGVVAPPSLNGSNNGGLGQIGGTPPAPPVPPRMPPIIQPDNNPPVINVPSNFDQYERGFSEPLSFDAPASKEVSAAEKVQADVKYQKNVNAGMLPAGSFASVALLNGLDAGTGTTTQSNPMPVLMNITDQAVLPGSARYKLKNCFVLGTAHGDLSAERVYARISRISCIDKADKLILSQEVQGYLVDSDGKLGMRGVITDRQGAKLGKAMLAGFAQGLTSALGNAQSDTSSNLSTGQAISSITGGSALKASGLSGAQNATSMLAEFYLKEAQAIFPVISVDAGRTGTLVFTGSTALNWANADGAYEKQITPVGK